MKNTVKPIIKCLPANSIEYNNRYEYYLAVSSDSLYVLNPEQTLLIECIIEGLDNNAYVIQFKCEDDFLDGILAFKQCYASNINLLVLLEGE